MPDDPVKLLILDWYYVYWIRDSGQHLTSDRQREKGEGLTSKKIIIPHQTQVRKRWRTQAKWIRSLITLEVKEEQKFDFIIRCK